MKHDCDVLVVGAGVAGLAAALRLSQFGRSVIVVERRPGRRPDAVESMSPGVGDMLRMLHAASALDGRHVRPAPAPTLVWDEPAQPQQRPAAPGAVLVHRAELDQSLLEAAQQAGVRVLTPTRLLDQARTPGGWLMRVGLDTGCGEISARFMFDARGRSGAPHAVRTAPPLLCLRADLVAGAALEGVRIEARPHGWLWGAPGVDGSFQVMAFCDPSALHAHSPGDPQRWLRHVCQDSVLFHAVTDAVFAGPVRACDASARLNPQWWSERCASLGDAAFTLDPLSSSGVEKALRFSLQAALGVHTLLSDPGAHAVVESFLTQRLTQANARHMEWTREAYARAWPREQGFWSARAAAVPAQALHQRGLRELAQAVEAAGVGEDEAPAMALPVDVRTLQQAPRLSPHVSTTVVPCAMPDAIRARPAIVHPGLRQPVAFVMEKELVPLLMQTGQARSFGELIHMWARDMPQRDAIRICAWLLQKGIFLPA